MTATTIVRLTERDLRGSKRRPLAIGAVYLVLMAGFSALAALVGPRLGCEMAGLGGALEFLPVLDALVINDQGASLPIAFRRRAIAEHKRKELEDLLADLRGLLEKYTRPTEGKALDFMNRAPSPGPMPPG